MARRKKVSVWFLVAALALTTAVILIENAQRQPPVPINVADFCLAGCPVGAPATNEIVRHHILTLSNNPERKFADWVAYVITPDGTDEKKCSRKWRADPALSTDDSLQPVDYEKAHTEGYDMGHQAPLADFCGSEYREETNYLTNITPQRSELNQGPWNNLERAERALVTSGKVTAVYSLTGPLYEKNMPALPHADQAHSVPSGYWKIVALPGRDGPQVAGFVMVQEMPRKADFCGTAMPLDVIEKRSGLTFFPELPPERKAEIEQKNSSALLARLGCN